MSFNLKSSPSHLLHRAQQLAASQSAEALKTAGLTLRQFALLAALDGKDGISQSDLVNLTGIDRSTLADMVARMEKDKLIKRTASKTDKRAKAVSMMAKGKTAFKKAQPAVTKADAALLNALPKTKQSGLVSSLSQVVAALDEAEAPVRKAAPAKPAPAKRKPAAKKKPVTKKKPAARRKTTRKKK